MTCRSGRALEDTHLAMTSLEYIVGSSHKLHLHIIGRIRMVEVNPGAWMAVARPRPSIGGHGRGPVQPRCARVGVYPISQSVHSQNLIFLEIV